jgi:hypothetical protein
MMSEKGVPESWQHLTRFTSFRPAGVSPDNPRYCPDRDYVNATVWINQVFALMTGRNISLWEGVASKLGIEIVVRKEDGTTKLSPEMQQCFEAFIRFLEVASGQRIVNEDFEGYSSLEEFPSFAEAVAELGQVEHKEHLVLLMSMLGHLLIDAMFFGLRQDILVGRSGRYTMDEILPIIQQVSASVLSGETPYERGVKGVRTAVDVGIAAGMSPAEIRQVVSDQIVAVHSE